MKLPRTIRDRVIHNTYLTVFCECGQSKIVRIDHADQKLCRTCAARKAGKASFAKMIDQYGYQGALQILRDRIDARPSEPELIVRSFLSRMNVAFRTNVLLFADERTGFIVDFEVNGLLIELDGYWHEADPKTAVRDAKLNAYFPDIIHVRTDSDLESEFAYILGLESGQ